eukprot:TRINITY_DN36387_c0_g1_i1.p1 TRINITY_DN36387_c0_g1~~TRINITY_DN36387_c0_g1_i1.p1  ORF type:complete len:203 (+),score=32.52 TRINITY_DN36387_c0_g1_i1:423-1031(+)
MDGNGEDKKRRVEEMYESLCGKKFERVPALDVQKLQELLDDQRKSGKEKVIVVDTRTEEEMKVSMIPGGTLQRKDFEQRKEEYRAHKVVCYCTLGYRSGKFAETLIAEKFDAYNLKGSLLAWTHAGLPLTDSYTSQKGSADFEDVMSGEAPSTKRVHVFTKDWTMQADGYEAVWFTKGSTPWAEAVWSTFRLHTPSWLGGGR